MLCLAHPLLGDKELRKEATGAILERSRSLRVSHNTPFLRRQAQPCPVATSKCHISGAQHHDSEAPPPPVTHRGFSNSGPATPERTLSDALSGSCGLLTYVPLSLPPPTRLAPWAHPACHPHGGLSRRPLWGLSLALMALCSQ